MIKIIQKVILQNVALTEKLTKGALVTPYPSYIQGGVVNVYGHTPQSTPGINY